MLLGTIAGDMAGSIFERHPLAGARDSFPLFSPRSRFTDDTVMTLAVAQGVREGYGSPDKTLACIRANMLAFGKTYPKAGYGRSFSRWLASNGTLDISSFGNGSAMRVSAVAWAYDTLEEVEEYAALSARITHGHPEGVKGAKATAIAIFLARTGSSKEDIRQQVTGRCGYRLDRTLAEIRPDYHFDVTCQGSVPEAIEAFLESDGVEDAIRGAIWLGGDADTQAAIAGSIAEAFYGGVPQDIALETRTRLDAFLLNTLESWQEWNERRSTTGV